MRSVDDSMKSGVRGDESHPRADGMPKLDALQVDTHVTGSEQSDSVKVLRRGAS